MFMAALDRRVRERGSDPAVITDGRLVTLSELAADFRSLAMWLERQGLGVGDPVAITIKDEYRHLLATLALLRIGARQITLPSYESAEYRQAIAARVGAAAVLVEDERHKLSTLPALTPDFASFATSIERAPADHEADAAIYFITSGTTGRPKITSLTESQLHQQARAWQHPLRKEVFFRPSSMEFNNAKRQRLYSLSIGSVNVFKDHGETEIAGVCRRFGVTRLALSGAQAHGLLEREADRSIALPATTHVRLGGGLIGEKLRRDIMRWISPNLHVVYATSEFGSISTAPPAINAVDQKTIGTIHPGIALQVVDDQDEILPLGRSGHIRVRGTGMASRYVDDPEASAKAFRGDWFYPGDIGHLSEDGRLYFEGRSDDMMNFASINIFPAEIESAFAAMPGVKECAAFSLRSENFGELPMLAVVGNNMASPDELLKHGKRLLGLRAPRRVFVIDEIPRNSAGKIARRDLSEFARRTMEKDRR